MIENRPPMITHQIFRQDGTHGVEVCFGDIYGPEDDPKLCVSVNDGVLLLDAEDARQLGALLLEGANYIVDNPLPTNNAKGDGE